jgi:hypothetical protein
LPTIIGGSLELGLAKWDTHPGFYMVFVDNFLLSIINSSIEDERSGG